MIYKPKNILVTGGAGFIGCNFIRYLLATYSDINIVNLDKLTYAGSLDNITDFADDERHKFVQGDIGDRSLVDSLLAENRIDTVVHFAAESHVDNSIKDPSQFIYTNLIGTYTLLEASRLYWLEEKKRDVKECRFHHISTDEVYGALKSDDSAFTEETAYSPNSPYSASKAGSDHLVRAYFHTYGLPVTTSNCSNNYGPHQHSEKFIPTIIRSCVEQKPIPVYGDGTNIRDWLYVEDHCHAVDRVIRKGKIGEVYNIGGGNERANIDIVRLICRSMDETIKDKGPHESLIQFVTDRPGHDWRYAINMNKLKDEFNWNPEESFESGIKKTVEWGILKSSVNG